MKKDISLFSLVFCGEISIVHDALRKMYKRSTWPKTTITHWMLNAGMHREITNLLTDKAERKAIGPEGVKGLWFRVIRLENRVKNAHQKILGLNTKESNLIIEKSRKVGIYLDGGIGDMIEDISIIEAWGKTKQLKFEYTADSKKIKIMEKFLKENNIKVNKTSKGVLSKMLIGAMGDEITKPNKFVADTETNIDSDRILCCWTAVGNGDRFSAMIRSVKFSEAWKFYERHKHHVSKFVDISNWKEWEKDALKELGVNLYDTANGDVYDLARLTKTADIVISIDTALNHIAAVMGKRRILLLPHYYDERWRGHLEKGSCYKKNAIIMRQPKLFDWDSVIKQIKIDEN